MNSAEFAVIDEADAGIVTAHNWYRDTYGYAVMRLNGALVYMHRLISGAPAKTVVDHRDQDPLNNTKGNLRVCSHAQNMQNRKMHANNSTGYKGVYPSKKKFAAEIKVNGKKHRLGTFDDPYQAHLAYAAAAVVMHGEFANLG